MSRGMEREAVIQVSGAAAAEIMIEAARGCVWCGAHPKNIGPWCCPRRSGLVAAALARSRAWRTLAETRATHTRRRLSGALRRPMLAWVASGQHEHRVRPAPIARVDRPAATQQPTRRLVAATTMHASARAPRTTGHMPRRRGSRPARALGGATASTRATARRSFRPSQPAPWNRRRGLLRSSTTGRASACGAPRPLT